MLSRARSFSPDCNSKSTRATLKLRLCSLRRPCQRRTASRAALKAIMCGNDSQPAAAAIGSSISCYASCYSGCSYAAMLCVFRSKRLLQSSATSKTPGSSASGGCPTGPGRDWVWQTASAQMVPQIFRLPERHLPAYATRRRRHSVRLLDRERQQGARAGRATGSRELRAARNRAAAGTQCVLHSRRTAPRAYGTHQAQISCSPTKRPRWSSEEVHAERAG
mmetsp:Transcript_10539/g.28022  ORF Transcript_10539/g.28022 Transcript_10539/m.28022 type:complete len:221 (-) Transcript_10539:268-930(-)